MNSALNFPNQPQGEFIQPPMVYVKEKPVWVYKQLVRNLRQEKAPTEEELNALGADSWELVGILADIPFMYFYFKRLVE